jgi:hypothetical protein
MFQTMLPKPAQRAPARHLQQVRRDATSLFWVAPTRSLKELFERIHNLPDPAEVVRIAAEHEVNFLPPPA